MATSDKFASYSNLESFWKRITQRYDKRLDKIENKKMAKLTFGSDKNYVYDGTEDIVIPVYNGEYEEK